MVLEDVFHYSNPKKSPHHDEIMASPIDRLAAQVADLIVFLPLLALVFAPFSRIAKEANLTGDEATYHAAMAGAMMSGYLSLVLYQWLTVVVWGGTPGKLALGLQLQSALRRDNPTSGEAFVRALAFASEAVFLGIPWLAVFTHPTRRTMHDRIAETQVVAKSGKRHEKNSKKIPVQPPTIAERSLARGFQAALSVSLVTVAILAMKPQWESEQSRDRRLAHARETEGFLCSEVREELDTVPGRSSKVAEDRLRMALSLFVTGDLTGDCLDSEAEFALWRNQSRPQAYLAKGLAILTDGDAKSSLSQVRKRVESYFAKACSEDSSGSSDECVMIDLVNSRGQQNAKDNLADGEAQTSVRSSANLDQVLARITPQSASYLRLQALRSLIEAHDSVRALEVIDTIESGSHSVVEGSRKIGEYLTQARIKALWESGAKTEARQALTAVQDAIEPSEKLELARNLCSAEISAQGCQIDKASVCRILSRSIEHSESWLMNPEVAAVYAHVQSCVSGIGAEKLRRLREKMPSEEGREYLEAVALFAEGQRIKAIASLKSQIESPTLVHGTFHLEAARELTERAQTRSELQPALATFAQMDVNEESRPLLGLSLVRKLNGLKRFEDAFKVALQLNHTGQNDQDLLKQMVIAAEGAGHHKMASGLMETLAVRKAERDDSEDLPLREPASAEEEVGKAVNKLLVPGNVEGEGP